MCDCVPITFYLQKQGLDAFGTLALIYQSLIYNGQCKNKIYQMNCSIASYRDLLVVQRKTNRFTINNLGINYKECIYFALSYFS
jgi:hypothetical protein